jgi:hypothetical protein
MKYIPLDQGAFHHVDLSLKNNKPCSDMKFRRLGKVSFLTILFDDSLEPI